MIEEKKSGLKKRILLVGLLAVVLAAMSYSIFYKDIRMYPNEKAVVKSLIHLLSTEAVFWALNPIDADANGGKNYWTYDISSFYRIKPRQGVYGYFTGLDLAMADAAPAPDDLFGGEPRLYSFSDIKPTPYQGYFLRAMLFDENGKAYNQVTAGVTAVAVANRDKFGIVAYPALYGETGRRTFIISKEGSIYYKDLGSDAAKIVLQWPPGGDPKEHGWEYADP